MLSNANDDGDDAVAYGRHGMAWADGDGGQRIMQLLVVDRGCSPAFLPAERVPTGQMYPVRPQTWLYDVPKAGIAQCQQWKHRLAYRARLLSWRKPVNARRPVLRSGGGLQWVGGLPEEIINFIRGTYDQPYTLHDRTAEVE